MGGKTRGQRRAEDAARSSERARRILEDQTKVLRARSDKEAIKAQRILMRLSRASGGGYFGTDTFGTDATTLGGSGDLR